MTRAKSSVIVKRCSSDNTNSVSLLYSSAMGTKFQLCVRPELETVYCWVDGHNFLPSRIQDMATLVCQLFDLTLDLTLAC